MAEASAKLNHMAHLHAIDKDVNLPPVDAVEVEEALMAVQGVEALLTFVTERLEQLVHLAAML